MSQNTDSQESEREDHMEELHRIQGMLRTIMKKKKRINGNGSNKGATFSNKTPERDAEVEMLRMQLQEQEVASTMRKADSSFLQSQLNEKEGWVDKICFGVFLIVLSFC